jgi:hypothetical protein
VLFIAAYFMWMVHNSQCLVTRGAGVGSSGEAISLRKSENITTFYICDIKWYSINYRNGFPKLNCIELRNFLLIEVPYGYRHLLTRVLLVMAAGAQIFPLRKIESGIVTEITKMKSCICKSWNIHFKLLLFNGNSRRIRLLKRRRIDSTNCPV